MTLNVEKNNKPSSKTWDKVSENYTNFINDDEIDLAIELMMLFNSLDLDIDNSLLELGSGSGHLSGIFSKYGYEVSLLDFSEVALSKSMDFFNNHSMEGHFIKGDLMELNLLDQQYDVTWNSGVMEHFDDKSLFESLKSIRRVTKKKFIFLVPNPDSLPYLLFRQKLMAEGKWEYGEEYLRNDYDAFLEKSGFKLIKKEFLGWNYSESQLKMLLKNNIPTKGLSKLVKNNLFSKENSYLIAYVAEPYHTSEMEHNWKGEFKGNTEAKTHIFDQIANQIHGSIGSSSTFNRKYLEITSTINQTFECLLNAVNPCSDSEEVTSNMQVFIDNVNCLIQMSEDVIDEESNVKFEELLKSIDSILGKFIEEYKNGYITNCKALVNKQLLLKFDEWQSYLSRYIEPDLQKDKEQSED
ncbi:class I SAM-dependent methyltransferase [Halobacillus trueperi]|uniref:Class I SAM-dependent methyltransferase n=1 Tax=Halobacillus trueperi TaxID=156205 RepID=A0A3D8VPY1_9BACI|nr:class I SAM-dependent methyltransferase [Halobacillus trueperi]RDY71529.1 class I SAM-dependent methyltransferase [Halobacillus trueperi]